MWYYSLSAAKRGVSFLRAPLGVLFSLLISRRVYRKRGNQDRKGSTTGDWVLAFMCTYFPAFLVSTGP